MEEDEAASPQNVLAEGIKVSIGFSVFFRPQRGITKICFTSAAAPAALMTTMEMPEINFKNKQDISVVFCFLF